MQHQPWRSVLMVVGVVVLFAGDQPLLAQSKATGLESFSRTSISEFAPGDGVRISVWRDISLGDQSTGQNLGLNGDFLIDNRGYILLPPIGEVRVTGHNRKTLARAIEDSLRIRAMRVFCSPLMRVTIIGAVNRPGSYLIEPKSSLWELISLAGGPANNSDLRKIYVQRRGRTINRNLLEGFEQGFSLDQLGVRSGDQVYVPNVSRVTVRAVLEYASIGASFALLYLQISDRTR